MKNNDQTRKGKNTRFGCTNATFVNSRCLRDLKSQLININIIYWMLGARTLLGALGIATRSKDAIRLEAIASTSKTRNNQITVS